MSIFSGGGESIVCCGSGVLTLLHEDKWVSKWDGSSRVLARGLASSLIRRRTFWFVIACCKYRDGLIWAIGGEGGCS